MKATTTTADHHQLWINHRYFSSSVTSRLPLETLTFIAKTTDLEPPLLDLDLLPLFRIHHYFNELSPLKKPNNNRKNDLMQFHFLSLNGENVSDLESGHFHRYQTTTSTSDVKPPLECLKSVHFLCFMLMILDLSSSYIVSSSSCPKLAKCFCYFDLYIYFYAISEEWTPSFVVFGSMLTQSWFQWISLALLAHIWLYIRVWWFSLVSDGVPSLDMSKPG